MPYALVCCMIGILAREISTRIVLSIIVIVDIFLCFKINAGGIVVCFQ